MKKEHFIIIVLVLLLVVACGVIGYAYVQGRIVASQQDAFQKGGAAGYQQAVADLMQQLVKCDPVPIHLGNQSARVIAVECLEAAQRAQGTTSTK